jgi:hypothetical protein
MGTFFSNEQLQFQLKENEIFLLNFPLKFQLIFSVSILLFLTVVHQSQLQLNISLPLLMPLLPALPPLVISSILQLFRLVEPKALPQFLTFLKPRFLQQFMPIFLISSSLRPLLLFLLQFELQFLIFLRLII